MAYVAEGQFSESVWTALGQADVQLSEAEHEALGALLAQGEARLRYDAERDVVDESFDVHDAAQELVERLLSQGSHGEATNRALAYGSVRDWICPLYPIC